MTLPLTLKALPPLAVHLHWTELSLWLQILFTAFYDFLCLLVAAKDLAVLATSWINQTRVAQEGFQISVF